MNDHRQLVSSGGPYELIVGYSRAVRVGDRIFVAGTAPQWPDGNVDPSPTVQARRCFEIIETALREAGATLQDVVRTRIFLVDANDFDEIGAVHGELFAETRPANTTLVLRGRVAARPGVEGRDRGRGDRRDASLSDGRPRGPRGRSPRDHGRRAA